MAAENVSVAAAFGLSYQDLDDGQQRLFRRLGLHPGPDIDAYAAAALDASSVAAARRRLEALYDQHLITEPGRGRYRFHDLMREHARTLAAAGDPAESDAAAGRLLEFYQHTALAAGGLIAARVPGTRLPPPPASPSAGVPPLATAAQAAGWLEAERVNLHAAAGYAAIHGHHQHAEQIAAAIGGFLYTRGYWDQAIALQRTAVNAARRAGDRRGQADAPHQLCLLQAETGNAAASANQRQAQSLYRDLGDRHGQAQALYALCFVHGMADDYPAGLAAAREALDLFRDLGDRAGEADALLGLGFLQLQAGDCPAAAASLRHALAIFHDLRMPYEQAETLNSLGELTRSSDSRQARGYHARALAMAATSAHHSSKPWPWKVSANPTSKTATQPTAPHRYGKHSRSTSASAPRAPCASSRPCASTESNQPPPAPA
jgi:tetratricopeptide (TPR) repeat protein